MIVLILKILNVLKNCIFILFVSIKIEKILKKNLKLIDINLCINIYCIIRNINVLFLLL